MSSQWEVIECRSRPGRVGRGESWQLAKLARWSVVSWRRSLGGGGDQLLTRVMGALAIGGRWENEQLHTNMDWPTSGSKTKH